MKTYKTEIKNAETLEGLLDVLRENEQEIEDDQYELSSLPTFGGKTPNNTDETWSWDSTQLLVGRCISEFEIIDREEA